MISERPDSLSPAGTGIVSSGDSVIAWIGIEGWAVPIPDVVTDPEQLRTAMNLQNNPEVDIEGELESLGVDWPLDEQEREFLQGFYGIRVPVSAEISLSTDGGSTWTATSVSEPITGIAIVGNAFVAVTSFFGDVTTADDEGSSLLTSTDGVTWTLDLDLPEISFGRGRFAATDDAIYVLGESPDTFLRIPAS
jgi:hypothetical protein